MHGSTWSSAAARKSIRAARIGCSWEGEASRRKAVTALAEGRVFLMQRLQDGQGLQRMA